MRRFFSDYVGNHRARLRARSMPSGLRVRGSRRPIFFGIERPREVWVEQCRQQEILGSALAIPTSGTCLSCRNGFFQARDTDAKTSPSWRIAHLRE